MIHSFIVTFGAKYLTGMVTSVPPYETVRLIKNNILHQSKNYKNHFKDSNFWGIWPLGHVGHVTYSFINMLFISTGIFDDKLRPQILSIGTTANSPLSYCTTFRHAMLYHGISSPICISIQQSFNGGLNEYGTISIPDTRPWFSANTFLSWIIREIIKGKKVIYVTMYNSFRLADQSSWLYWSHVHTYHHLLLNIEFSTVLFRICFFSAIT